MTKKIIVTETQAKMLKENLHEHNITSFNDLVDFFVGAGHGFDYNAEPVINTNADYLEAEKQLLRGEKRFDILHILTKMRNMKENPAYHGNDKHALDHLMKVTQRLIDGKQNINLILAGFFHDMGKPHTMALNPKNPKVFRTIGHENVSAQIVDHYKGKIVELGGNPELIKNLVSNHMRYHIMPQMKAKKQADMKALDYFNDLEILGQADNKE